MLFPGSGHCNNNYHSLRICCQDCAGHSRPGHLHTAILQPSERGSLPRSSFSDKMIKVSKQGQLDIIRPGLRSPASANPYTLHKLECITQKTREVPSLQRKITALLILLKSKKPPALSRGNELRFTPSFPWC